MDDVTANVTARKDPCTELLEHFRDSEQMLNLKEHIEGRIEMIVVTAIVIIIAVCLIMAAGAEFTALAATMPEVGVIGIHQRRSITRMLLYRRLHRGKP